MADDPSASFNEDGRFEKPLRIKGPRYSRRNWTEHRVVWLSYLVGSGLNAEQIANHPNITSSVKAVQMIAWELGLQIDAVGHSTQRLTVRCHDDTLRSVETQAAARGMETHDYVRAILKAFQHQPWLASNIVPFARAPVTDETPGALDDPFVGAIATAEEAA